MLTNLLASQIQWYEFVDLFFKSLLAAFMNPQDNRIESTEEAIRIQPLSQAAEENIPPTK